MKKLNKETLNANHHSTRVAESKHAICIKATAVVKSTEGLQWTNLDYDSVISLLNKHLHKLRFPSVTPSVPKDKTSSGLDNKSRNQRSNSALSPPKDDMLNTESEISNDEVEFDIATADSSNTPSLGDMCGILSIS